QTQQLRYKDFKQSLLNYLLFSPDNQGLAETMRSQLTNQLNTLYHTYDNQLWDSCLLLRTCNRLIESFTVVEHGNPARLFILLASQGKALTLAILLLKIVLLCPQSYTHLECCLAQLIHYYKSQPETECQWLTHFLEVIQLTLTIYAEDVQYNLLQMSQCKLEKAAIDEENSYRIFSQSKGEVKACSRAAQ
ncbi:MAG TPA: hypothetical protein V6C91_19050, partial [Coleofasciculaceae cyanobacterium]